MPDVAGAVRKTSRRVMTFVRGLARLTWRAAGWTLLGAGLVVCFRQPSNSPVDAGLVVAIGSLLGLALSVGAAVALLIAQSTAERYPRQIFREFRRDSNWIVVIAVAALGVCATVAAALWRATLSTAWAALLALVGVLLVAAVRLPRLLDSLDAVELAERFTARTVNGVRAADGWARTDDRTRAGVEGLVSLTRRATASEDPEVVRAALGGINDVITSHIQSRAYTGIDDATCDFILQRYELVVEAATRQSRVVVLPAVVESLSGLGKAAAGLNIPLNRDWEPVTMRVASLLSAVAASSLQDQVSSAGSMATASIADCAIALLKNERSRSIGDHVRELRYIGVATLASGAFHMTAQASYGLARVSEALVQMSGSDIMESSYFEDAGEAIAAIASAYLEINTGPWGVADSSVLPIVGPLAKPNVAALAVAGLAHSRRSKWTGYTQGANVLFDSARALAFPDRARVVVAADARLACYSAIVGLLAAVSTTADLAALERWWTAFVPHLLRCLSDRERASLDDASILTALLLWATYRRDDLPVDLQPQLDALLSHTLDLSFGENVNNARREIDRVWRTVGAGCLGIGYRTLAEQIAHLVDPVGDGADEAPWRAPRVFLGAPLWNESFSPPLLLQGVESPPWRSDHDHDSNREAFLALSRA